VAAARSLLIVFAKAPRAGFAKTRLAAALGEAGAARIARALLDSALRAAIAAANAAGASVELCAAPTPDDTAFGRWRRTPGLRLAAQGEGDLGARMRRAFERARDSGARRVLLLGTDAPALDAAALAAALAALDHQDAVLVPAHDGGYAAIGLRLRRGRPLPRVFEAMPWSTAAVWRRTQARLVRAGHRVKRMPAVADIDTPADLRHLPAGSAPIGRAASPGAATGRAGPRAAAVDPAAPLPERVRAALATTLPALAAAAIEAMPDTGLAHWHLRLAHAVNGHGLVVRVPKQSQLGLAAARNLAHQAACFERAAAGGHAPALFAVLPPSRALPRGALVVEHIEGRPARLPQDLPAIAEALAALHRLPRPAAAARAPLANPRHTLAALAAEIHAQAAFLPAAGLEPATAAALAEALDRWQRTLRRAGRPPRRLIAFDAHPGNFVIRPDGRAVLVDLEKARYGDPPLDVAHASLYTSTTWDLHHRVALEAPQVAAFVHAWGQALGPAASAWWPWIAPLREAMWLWSMTWCAKWRVLSAQAAREGGDGEDWSQAHSEPTLVAHVRDRVQHYLAPATVHRMQREAQALARLL
jgi:rSAM/selenodomain-associated transferase 1